MLGQQRLDAAWAAGRALSLEQAIEYGLTAPAARRGPAPQAPVPPASTVNGQADSPLTARELEVALLLARGLTNRQIADELVIAERTASTHVTHILTKLGFSTRAQVAVWAVERGLAGR